jgi:hypothetical protein
VTAAGNRNNNLYLPRCSLLTMLDACRWGHHRRAYLVPLRLHVVGPRGRARRGLNGSLPVLQRGSEVAGVPGTLALCDGAARRAVWDVRVTGTVFSMGYKQRWATQRASNRHWTSGWASLCVRTGARIQAIQPIRNSRSRKDALRTLAHTVTRCCHRRNNVSYLMARRSTGGGMKAASSWFSATVARWWGSRMGSKLVLGALNLCTNVNNGHGVRSPGIAR